MDRAFHFLARASSTSNVKLREVAQEIVDATEERFSPPVALDDLDFAAFRDRTL